jgi:hypothetical protein
LRRWGHPSRLKYSRLVVFLKKNFL